jgi:anti-anti-sigma factor
MSRDTAVPASRQVTVRDYLTVQRVRQRYDLERVHPIGEIDLCTAPALRDALADVDTVPNVLVDLSRVHFLALVGVHVLRAAGERRAAANHRLVVVAATPAVQRVLSLTEAAGELEIYVSARSALASLS